MRLASPASLMSMLVTLLWCAAATGAGGDAAAGKRKTVTCNGCHKVASMTTVPNLGGQSPSYFVMAMRAYQDAVRTHATMRDVARDLAERDFRNLAAYYAESAAAPPAQTKDPAAPAGAERCAICHLSNGRDSAAPDVPRLAGQKASFIEQMLRDYRAGTRKHAVMNQQAAGLSDQEITDLSAYYSGLGGLFAK